MCNKNTLTTLITCLLLVIGFSAVASNLYVDMQEDNQMRSAIWRYDEAGNPSPADGKDGARFIEFTGEARSDNHCFAYGPDGNLYFTTYSDPTKKYLVRRANSLGQIDAGWSVSFQNPYASRTEVSFAPDGRLYVMEYVRPTSVYLIDIANKTKTLVMIAKDSNGQDTYAADIDFDSQGRAYVSYYTTGEIRRFTVSGTTWRPDAGFVAHMPPASAPSEDWLTNPGDTGLANKMAYNPADGYLYVNDEYKANVGGGNIYRFNSTGTRDMNWKASARLNPLALPAADGMKFGPDGRLYVAASRTAPPNPITVVACTTDTPSVVTDFVTIDQNVTGTQSYFIGDICWDRPLPGSISGQIVLQNFNLAKCPVAVEVQLMQAGKTVRTDTLTIGSGSSGNYSISNVAPGSYDLAFKAPFWLRKVLTGKVVNAAMNTPGCDVTLTSGDSDYDNEVTSTDLSAVLSNTP